MADTEPNETPEQPEDAAAEAPTPDDAQAPKSDEAEDLAAAALKAAQEAVSGLDDEEAADGAPTPASDDGAAAPETTVSAGAGDAGASPVSMPSFDPGKLADAPEGIDMLSDVNLDVTIELGRTRMFVEDVLKLAEGAVVELDKLAGDPVDIYVNQRHVARGEVLILNDNFCVRVNEIVETHAEAAAG